MYPIMYFRAFVYEVCVLPAYDGWTIGPAQCVCRPDENELDAETKVHHGNSVAALN